MNAIEWLNNIKELERDIMGKIEAERQKAQVGGLIDCGLVIALCATLSALVSGRKDFEAANSAELGTLPEGGYVAGAEKAR